MSKHERNQLFHTYQGYKKIIISSFFDEPTESFLRIDYFFVETAIKYIPGSKSFFFFSKKFVHV